MRVDIISKDNQEKASNIMKTNVTLKAYVC